MCIADEEYTKSLESQIDHLELENERLLNAAKQLDVAYDVQVKANARLRADKASVNAERARREEAIKLMRISHSDLQSEIAAAAEENRQLTRALREVLDYLNDARPQGSKEFEEWFGKIAALLTRDGDDRP